MIIDIAALILLAIALYKGFTKGLIVALFSFLALLVGLAAALKLSALVAEYLGTNTNVSGKWLPVLAFLLVFIAAVLLVRLGAKAIEAAFKMAMLGWLNRLGGILFFSLLYLFAFSIILFYAQKIPLIKPETAAASVFYPYLAPLAPKIIQGMATVLPFLKDMFAELSEFFDGVAHKAG